MTRSAAAALILLALTGSAATRPHAGGWPQTNADPQLVQILALEDARAPHPDDIRLLIRAAHGITSAVQAAAIRALGRLERRDVVADLIPLLAHRSDAVRAETANALAQALRGAPLPGDSDGAQVQAVQAALLRAGNTTDVDVLAAICRSLGRLPYATPEQIHAADAFLGGVLGLPRRARPELATAAAAAVRGLESLARRRKIAPLSNPTLEKLRRIASGQEADASDDLRRNAVAALGTAGAHAMEMLAAVLQDPDPEVRRLGALALAAPSGMDADQRRALIQAALEDRAAMVRYEALRAWARREAETHGCEPLVDGLADDSMHVVLAATDLLGEHCPTDSAITDRLTAEARTPPPLAWHREAHAFVALARRSPERARLAMPAFVSHPTPHVRKYAARAAAVLDDVTALQRLAVDEDDNVAEVALPPLRRLLGRESDPVFIAALNRRARTVGRHQYAYPYQVFRTAAIELKGATGSAAIGKALVAALQRATADNHETSRDVRLALIERIEELGSAELASAFTPLLRDIDPAVAGAAADTIGRWTGKRPQVAPQPARRPLLADPSESRSLGAVIVLGSGRRFQIAFADEAPLARMRFVQLARSGYYNGLTFHRVEPNFVIQGGSPNAHEYVGDRSFMRDELGLATHRRGAIGISTRGRDTGDAQIFVNLVDNPRLDHEYTVFAYVQRGASDHMEIVDSILEGEVITRVEITQRR